MDRRSERSSDRRRFLKRLAAGAVGATALSTGLPGAFGPFAAPRPNGSGAGSDPDRILHLAGLFRSVSPDEAFDLALRQQRAGATWRELLGGIFLAGVHDIEPRPVGFKLHTLMIAASVAELAGAAPPRDRLVPVLFNLNDLKESQQEDRRGGDWTLPPSSATSFPDRATARQRLAAALEAWDESEADRAVTGAMPWLQRDELFEVIWAYGARDYRDIGHKMIYTSQVYRALEIIGWERSEPALRSLVAGLLYGGPGETSASFDANRGRLAQFPDGWQDGDRDPEASRDLLARLRTCDAGGAADHAIELLRRGVAPDALWDGYRLMASELLLRAPGLLAVHPMTTINAFNYAFGVTRAEQSRRLILLQAASWLPQFRDELRRRVGLADGPSIDALQSVPSQSVDDPFSESNLNRRIGKAMSQASDPHGASAFVQRTRSLVLQKGDETHHYKYSVAAIEEHGKAHPQWASRLLAASLAYLPGARDVDAEVYLRARRLLDREPAGG
jgi:hypothetical protein